MEIFSVDPIEKAPRGRPKGSVASIREVHHTVAQLYARGAKPTEIGAMINRTGQTIRNWLATPAMAELVAQYAGEFNIELVSEVDYNTNLKRHNRTAADEEIARRLAEAPQDIPLRDLVKISADASDRTGLARQETKVNLNMNLGDKLERASERVKAVKEARAVGGHDNVVKMIRRA